jgi:hypothetical protein
MPPADEHDAYTDDTIAARGDRTTRRFGGECPPLHSTGNRQDAVIRITFADAPQGRARARRDRRGSRERRPILDGLLDSLRARLP